MTTTSPYLRLQALDRANEIRFHRAKARRTIRALPAVEARERMVELIVDPPAWLRSIRIERLLRWQPYVGEAAAMKLLKGVDVRDSLKVGTLTKRQRLLIAEAVKSR